VGGGWKRQSDTKIGVGIGIAIDWHTNHRRFFVGAHGVRPDMTTAAPVLTEQNSGAVLFAMGFTNILLLALAQAPRTQRQKERKT
jgi:hypothetical protein